MIGIARLTGTIGLAVALLASSAHAAPPEDANSAEALYEKGVARYQTEDYNGAIELWTEAYSALGWSDENAEIRAVLLRNIAKAHLEAYEIDLQASHLRQADRLVKRYLEQAGEGADTADVESLSTEIQEKLAGLEEEEAPTAEPEPEPEPESTPPEPVDDARPGRGLIIAGGVTAGVGAACLGVMGWGLARASTADSDLESLFANNPDLPASDPEARTITDRGKASNRIALAMGVTGGVLVTTGAVLLGVGFSKRARATAFAPSLGPGFTGVTWSGKF